MRFSFKKLVVVAFLAATCTFTSSPSPARAQTYPIDCAILLCLSGGWPASVPCALARAEFIRRITPWPVEPPLQIWRCPMGASFNQDVDRRPSVLVFEAAFGGIETPLNLSQARSKTTHWTRDVIWRNPIDSVISKRVPADYALRLVQNRADIDISGPEFDFVRSIRVYYVRYAWQRESGRDGDCNRSAAVRLGTYGEQGNFSWHRSSPSALPAAHKGLERWGRHCPPIYHRSVFVDWRDYGGNYGFKQINY